MPTQSRAMPPGPQRKQHPTDMNKRQLIWYLPIAATVANAIVFARFLATGLWQEVASAISIMWCVCAVAAIMMRKSQAEKDNYQFTLAADALIAGGIVLTPSLTGWEGARMLLWPALIPAADVVRFFCLRDEVRCRRTPSPVDKPFVASEALMLFAAVGSVIVWNGTEMSAANIASMACAAILFAVGMSLLANKRLNLTYADEASLPMTLIFVAVGIAIYSLKYSRDTADKVFYTIIAATIALIVWLDRIRSR